MLPPQHDLERRRPVWEALSELFLDTESSDAAYRSIAARIVASGYSPAEIRVILWDEVYPAAECNLRQPAGEWRSFDGDWLEQRILGRPHGRTLLQRMASAVPGLGPGSIVRKAWRDLLRFLPPNFGDASDV